MLKSLIEEIGKPEMAVLNSPTSKGISLKAIDKKDLNAAIQPYTTSAPHNTYFKNIPLREMMRAIKGLGVTPIQEDGTEWSGFLVGREGRATIHLAVRDTEGVLKEVKNAALIVSWHRMDSGNYEVTAYIS